MTAHTLAGETPTLHNIVPTLAGGAAIFVHSRRRRLTAISVLETATLASLAPES
ncbi:hypothetical+protein [Methylocapsa aurea]